MGELGDRVRLEPGEGVPERDELGLPLGELRGESPIHCMMLWKGAPLENFPLSLLFLTSKESSSSRPQEEWERRRWPLKATESTLAGAEEERRRAAGMLSEAGEKRDGPESGGLPSESQLSSS